jgi:aminopeptidase N
MSSLLLPTFSFNPIVQSPVPVQHPDEINEVFDAISYQKGASLIRMVENFIGVPAMKAGLKVLSI